LRRLAQSALRRAIRLALPRRGVAVLVLIAAAVALQGCGLIGSPPPPCPRVAIMDQAKTATFFRDGPGRDLTDVTFEALIVDLVGACDYDIDGDDSSVSLEYSILFTATRGPAATSNQITVPFFVALADPEGGLVAKQVFEAQLVFPEYAVRVQSTEEIHQEIPFNQAHHGADYETFVGFQLSRGQLEDLRRMRAN